MVSLWAPIWMSRTASPSWTAARARAAWSKQRLRALLSSDELDSDGRLPTERELAGMYGVSRTTVRQVLDGLEHAGLIRRRRGRTGGTFATRGRVDIDFGYLAGIPSYLRAQGFRAGAHVVSARMVPADSGDGGRAAGPAGGAGARRDPGPAGR